MKMKKRELYRAFTKDIKAFGLLVIAVERRLEIRLRSLSNVSTVNLIPGLMPST